MVQDAKSRYEIVDGLVTKKETLLSNINRAKKEYQTNLDLISLTKIEQKRTVEDLELKVKQLKINTDDYIKSINVRIKAYDDAIEAIKAISGGIDSNK